MTVQTAYTINTLYIAWRTMVFVPYWPTLLRMSCHSHCRIISLFAWIRSTPKVLAPIKFITLLYPIFKSLKNINEQRAVTRYIFINKDSGQPRHEHHACHRNQYRQQGQPSPIPIGYFYWKSVKTNIRSYEIQHDKPWDIIYSQSDLRYSTYHTIHQQTKKNKP